MFVEFARPVTLVFCILSLYAVFHTAFLSLTQDVDQRLFDSLALLALAAGISVVSGLIFREATQNPIAPTPRLTATLPVQMFCWAAAVMVVLFVVSWYLETYCVFYRDIRF
jgi:cation transport ATPase